MQALLQNPILNNKVDGANAWTVETLPPRAGYVDITNDCIEELDGLIGEVRRNPLPLPVLRPDDFELPEWGFSFEIAAEYDTDGKARDVSIRGDSALIADYDEGFLILDISDVSDINELDRYKQPGFIYSSNIEAVSYTHLTLPTNREV